MSTITHESEVALAAVAEARDKVLAAERERDEAILRAAKPSEDGGGGANLRSIAQQAGVSHETVRKIVREQGYQVVSPA